MPTLHGVGAARNARSSEKTDAFTTRNLAQAFLSTPPSRITPSPHDFMERGDNASLTPKPPRTVVGGPTNTPLINAHVTDDVCVCVCVRTMLPLRTQGVESSYTAGCPHRTADNTVVAAVPNVDNGARDPGRRRGG